MNLKVMLVISRILQSDENAGKKGRFRPSAALRLIAAFLCILLCALSKNIWFTLSVIAIQLLRTACMSPKAVAGIMSKTFTAALFTLIFSLPILLSGHPTAAVTLTLKIIESVLVLSVLNKEVSWKETTDAFQAMHMPAVVTMVLDFTVRYLVILGRLSTQMLEAVSLRRVGKKEWRNAGTGGILGTCFLKSRKMAEMTSEAMICRGFTGSLPARKETLSYSQKVSNCIYSIVFALLLLGYWYTESHL